MSAMRRLAILDFDFSNDKVDSLSDLFVGIIVRSAGLNYGDDYDLRNAASYATDGIYNALKDTNYFEIVDSVTLADISQNNSISTGITRSTDGADAILTGSLNYTACGRQNFTKEKIAYDSNKKKEVMVQEPWVRQKCQLTLNYRVSETKNNNLVIKKQFRESRNQEVSQKNIHNLNEPEYWYRDMINKIIPKISHQLSPYKITETRHLKVDKTYDSEMKRAETLAKAGNHAKARDIFLQRWRATSNPAAGYNAALLYEVEGDLEKALKLLGEVISINSDNTIVREHRNVLKAIEEQRQVKKQLQ